MALLKKEKRDQLVAQSLQEIQHARQYKQGKITNWQKNEDLYYGVKSKPEDTRANVGLSRMQEFVHTILSKIDNPLIFKFVKKKESQHKYVEKLNALRDRDRKLDSWDIKDIVGKKQCIIYGRAIYEYHADSVNGYTAHLENVDVYDFLIDPSANGIDLETASYMGRYGVVKTKAQIKQGIKDGIYLRTEGTALVNGAGNASNESAQEETNKRSRSYAQNTITQQKEVSDPNKYVFWEWYTTDNETGERYYLLLQNNGGESTAIRVERLTDIFESDLFPFWSYAAFPDLTEFWTPSYCDYVREIFMAQEVSINQMLDNSEQINKPQRVIVTSAIENLTELKFRPNAHIRVKQPVDINKVYQRLETPQIDTPMKVFESLEGVHEKASGVTAGAKGIAEEDKVGIYEGNQANTADRFGLLNKSYALMGYERFAKLYEHGVREHLTKKVAIDVLGPDGVDVEMVSRRDIFKKGENYGVVVEASNAETALSMSQKRTQLTFLGANAGNPIQNPKKSYEISASIAGFSEDVIRQLMDTSDFGNAEMISEAERDIEDILDGKTINLNENANVAYKQRFVTYIKDHKEDIDMEQFNALTTYLDALEPIIMQNMVSQIQQKQQQLLLEGQTAPQPQAGGAVDQSLNGETLDEPLDVNPY